MLQNVPNSQKERPHSGQGCEWQIIHDGGSLCISMMWLFNFFLVERTLKQELQNGIRDQGEFDYNALLHHQAVLHILGNPPLPLHLLLIIIILQLLLPVLLLLPLLQSVWKASRPSLLSCRDLKDRHWEVCIQALAPKK